MQVKLYIRSKVEEEGMWCVTIVFHEPWQETHCDFREIKLLGLDLSKLQA